MITESTAETTLRKAQFVFLGIPVLLGPWLFGAWEMWWFWAFTVSVFLSALCLGLRLLLAPGGAGQFPTGETPRTAFRKGAVVAALYLVFLAYAVIRFLQADVRMDAERSLLLHVTPLLLGLQVLCGLEPRQQHRLRWLLIANLALLGLYGIVNHVLTGSQLVLWAEGYAKYLADGRGSGSYFCPDHFSGAMELALALGLGLALTRKEDARRRGAGGVLCLIALAGILISKSRGGGLTVVVILAATLIWGFMRWPSRKRGWSRLAAAAAVAIVLVIFWNAGTGYVDRFTAYFRVKQVAGQSRRERVNLVYAEMLRTSRGRMIGAGLRAWRDAPVFGIGPGMHQHLWPHYAASSDGDRERGVWPSLPNHDFHSYEVHSDWVQLLEEYGIVGLILFLLPAAAFFIILVRSTEYSAPLLGGILAFLAMAFHSLGDFNLQMPGTTWMLAAILALAMSDVTQRIRRRKRSTASTPNDARRVSLDT